MSMFEQYIGTKIVNAVPMAMAEYNHLRGWDLPIDVDGSEMGYLVEDINTSHANHPRYKGYITWIPLGVFQEYYKPISYMTFSHALVYIKQGYRVARKGWNGKDMFIFLVPGSNFKVNRPPLLGIYPEGTPIEYLSHVDMKTADGSIVPWICSQTDLLAEDWEVVK